MKRGAVTISIDVEFAWGFNYELLLGESLAFKYLRIIKERSRRNMFLLLKLSEKYNIPFTWAFVGHLFLKGCERVSGVPHPDMPRPRLEELDKDWYFYDPCGVFEENSVWYAPDVVERILESRVEHEIACHSFSHVDFSRCSREVARAEVRKCKELAKEYDIELLSFVFPKNRVGHLDVLWEEGFRVFRFKYAPPRYKTRVGKYILPVLSPLTSSPLKISGLVGVPSILLFQSLGKLNVIRLEAAAIRGINRAVERGEVFHISMHDFLESDALLSSLARILSYVSKLREQGKVDVLVLRDYFREDIWGSD